MKKVMVSLLLLAPACVYPMGSSARVISIIRTSNDRDQIMRLIENTRDPRVIRFLVEDRAKQFGERRANPISYAGCWEAAYTAYVFNELKQGKRLLDILDVGREVTSAGGFHTWDDAPLRPYFQRALDHWRELSQSMESDWALVCARLNATGEAKSNSESSSEKD